MNRKYLDGCLRFSFPQPLYNSLLLQYLLIRGTGLLLCAARYFSFRLFFRLRTMGPLGSERFSTFLLIPLTHPYPPYHDQTLLSNVPSGLLMTYLLVALRVASCIPAIQ
jgi:hypothetical protein